MGKKKQKIRDSSSPEKEAFCKILKDAAKEENVAVGEYVALALDALKIADLSTLHKQREAISILLEKIRDDEGSHRDALTKIAALVCPIK